MTPMDDTVWPAERPTTPVLRDASREGVAAVRLYEAETALHHARQTRVDAWITAAYDRLHEAIDQYLRERTHTPLNPIDAQVY